jgi:hypothetical protein
MATYPIALTPLKTQGLDAQSIVPATNGDQRLYYASLVNALSASVSDIVTPIQALAVMAVIEAAFDSARRRSAVELPLTAEERVSWRREWG